MSLSQGDRLGRYEILAQLGAGGMGEVYRAHDEQLDREVAVKVLPETVAGDTDRLARFDREAKAVAALSHPNILAIHDFGTERGIAYAVTELLEGETLRDRLQRDPIGWRKAVEVGAAIADGLASAHNRGVIHRDLKPENVFLTSDGQVKVLDFGLAKVEEPVPGEAATVTSPPPGTVAGTVLGTVGYMAPEQVRAQAVDGRSDIFALGCVLYEVLTGERAFTGQTFADTSAAVLREEPPPISAAKPGVPPALETVVFRCLEKRPEERFQSARDLVFALQVAGRASEPTRQPDQDTSPPPPPTEGVTAGPIRSIAVLPFAATTDVEEIEYLADGLTDGLIGRLSGLTGIDRVIARHSVFRYKGKEIDPVAVGTELGVDAVLMGEVAARGDTLVIGPELVGTAHATRIWGGRFTSESGDLLGVEEEISRAIVDNLSLQLSHGDHEQVAKRHTENPEAHRLYLKGRYLWNKRTREAIERSIELYQEAIAMDPKFATAYTGIADAWVALCFNDFISKGAAFREALSAVLAALEIDDEVSEAHVSFGAVLYSLGTDWTRAEKEFRRALEIDQLNAEACHQYAHLLSLTGRDREAIEMMRRAIDLEPVSPIINSCFGQVLYLARRYQDAVAQYAATIELDPSNVLPHAWLGMVHVQMADHARAEEAFDRGLESSTFAARIHGALGYSHAIRGNRDNATVQLDRLANLAHETPVDPCFEAWIHTGLGDQETALDRLEAAYDQDVPWLVFLKVDPFFDSIRDAPRYRKILRGLKLIEG
jgi:serine/threonine-protein kinase